MPEEQETLSELIERRLRELAPRGQAPLTARDLWRRGGGLTGQWSHQTVNDLVAGKPKWLRDKTVERLALALEVSENQVRAAVGERRRNRPFQLPPRAAALSESERRIMLEVLDGILGKYRDEEQPRRRSPRTLRAVEVPQPPEAVAARRGRSKGKQAAADQDADAERSQGPHSP